MANPGSGAGPFIWAVRVYHEDTDGSGAVYHANYLKFFERARTEWLRSLGFGQSELAARHEVVFVVRSLAVEYLKPAAYDDALEVSVEPVEVKGGQVVLAQRIARGGVSIASARVRIACVNTGTFKPVRIPAHVSRALDPLAADDDIPEERS